MMESSGDYRKFSKEMRNIFSKNVDSFVPALIGLMPMPGGALFTAPIVKNSLPEENPLKLAVKNYWFRHTIEFFWPIYPAVVLVSELSGIHPGKVSLTLFPVFAIAFLLGWFFFNGKQLPRLSKPRSFFNLLPLIPVLGTGVLILIFKVPGWFALLLSTSGYAVFRRRYLLKTLKQVFNKWDVFLVLFLVYIYKVIVEHSGVGEGIAAEFVRWNLSPWILLIFLPLVSGISTGITQAAVGISLPVLMEVFSSKYAVYTYMFAVGGVILSPVHLCVVLSAKFFEVEVFDILKKVFLPLVLTLILGALVLGVIL
jgi:integral membrane protein (TIGR00529 family)